MNVVHTSPPILRISKAHKHIWEKVEKQYQSSAIFFLSHFCNSDIAEKQREKTDDLSNNDDTEPEAKEKEDKKYKVCPRSGLIHKTILEALERKKEEALMVQHASQKKQNRSFFTREEKKNQAW